MAGTEWVPGSYGNNRHSSRKLSPGRAPVPSSRVSYRDRSPTGLNEQHSFDPLAGRSGTSAPRSRSGDLISEHSRARTVQTKNIVGLDSNLLLSKPMGSMTLTELREAFMTMPVAIKETLMTPSSTLELMTAADDSELLCAPDTEEDRPYSQYNYSVQLEDGRKRANQRDRSSDMSTPVLARGVFYTQGSHGSRPENAPTARTRTPSRIPVTPAATAQGRSHSSSKAMLPAADGRRNFTSQQQQQEVTAGIDTSLMPPQSRGDGPYDRSSANSAPQNTKVPAYQSSTHQSIIDKKQLLEWSQKQAWERGVRHDLTPTHATTTRSSRSDTEQHCSIDGGAGIVAQADVKEVPLPRSSAAATVTDQAEWRRMTEWLTRTGLSGYIDNMQSHGVTKLSMIELFSEQDMRLIGISQPDIPVMMRNIREFSKRTRSLSEQALLRDGSSSSSVGHRVLPHHQSQLPSNTDATATYSGSKLGLTDSSTAGASNHTVHVESNKSLDRQPPHFYTNSDDVANELLRCFDRGEAKQFFLVWRHALLCIPAHPTSSSSVSAVGRARQVIEFHLHVHFAVYPMTHHLGKIAERNATRLLKLYLEEALASSELSSSNDDGTANEALSPVKCLDKDKAVDSGSSSFSSPSASPAKHDLPFAQSREYALCAAIALVPDPKQNVAFQQLLRPDWMQALRRRLTDFLTSTILSAKGTGDELTLGLRDNGNNDLLIPTRVDAVDRIPTRRDAAVKVPPRGDAVDKIPFKGDAVDKIPSRVDAVDKILTRGDAVDKIPSRVDAVDKIPSRGDAVDKIPFKGDAVDKIPFKGDAVDKIPSRVDAVDKIPSRGDAVNKIPSRVDAVDKIPFKGDAVDKIPSRVDAVDKISSRGDAVDKIPTRDGVADGLSVVMVGQSRNREKVRRFIKHRTIQETSYAASGRVSGLLDDYQLSPMHCCLSDATNEPLVTDFVLEVQPASSPTASEISQLTADSARPHAAAAGGGGGGGGQPPDSDSAIASRTPHKSPLHIGEAGKPTESAIARKHSPSASVFTRKLINSSSQQLLFDKANKTSPSAAVVVVPPSTRPQTGGSVVRSATGAAGARVHHPSASRAMQLQVTKYNKLLRRRQEPLQSIIDTAVRTDNRSADDMMIGGSADDAVEVDDGGGEGIRSADDRMIGGSADDTVEVSDGELMTG